LLLKIETRIVEFESVLKRVDEQLTASADFFQTTVSKFDGTVSLSSKIPQPSAVPLVKIRVRRDVHLIPTSVNASYVMQMAEGYITSSHKNNVSGRAIYTTIADEYKKVRKTLINIIRLL
jgi:hypothetical protein